MAIAFAAATLSFAYKRRFAFAVFYLLCAIETYTKLRYPFHHWFRVFLLDAMPPGTSKQIVQLWMLAGLAIVISLLTGFSIAFLSLRCLKNMFVFAGTLGVIAMLAIELISHHEIDRFIYANDGPLVRSGTIYIISTLVAITGTLLASSRHSQTVDRAKKKMIEIQ